MKHLNDTEKYLECRATLECIIRALRSAYNEGLFNGPTKRYVFNLLREGDTTIRKISE